jgi:hypothetical protein
MIYKDKQEKQDSNNYSLIAITAATTTALLTGGTYLICNIKPQFCPPMFKAHSNTLSLTVSSTVNTALSSLNAAVINGLQKSLSKENLVHSALVEVTSKIVDLFPDETPIIEPDSFGDIGSTEDLSDNNSNDITPHGDADILTPTRSVVVDGSDDIAPNNNDKAADILTPKNVETIRKIDSIDEALGVDRSDLVDSSSNSASNSPLPPQSVTSTDIIVRTNTPDSGFNGLNDAPVTTDLLGSILTEGDNT